MYNIEKRSIFLEGIHMDKLNNYYYLGKCIQKIRIKSHLTQEELCQGICSKYTLSRIENNTITPNTKHIDELLSRLGYHHKDCVDLVIRKSIFTHLEQIIDYYHYEDILFQMERMKTILERNQDNVLFYDDRLLYHYMETHYSKKQKILITPYELNTLSFLSPTHYHILIHVLSENLIFYSTLNEFVAFYHTLPYQQGSLMLDYYYCIYLQYHSQILEVDNIYKRNVDELRNTGKQLLLLHYQSIYAIGHIKYEPYLVSSLFMEIHHFYRTNGIEDPYHLLFAFARSLFHIRKEEYEIAFHILNTDAIQYPVYISSILHYLIFLALISDNCIKDELLTDFDNPFLKECIAYYHYRRNGNSYRRCIHYMKLHFPPYLIPFDYNSIFITLVRLEIHYLQSHSKCYKSTTELYYRIKESCKGDVLDDYSNSRKR